MTKPLAIIIEDDEGLTTIFAHALQKANYAVEVILDGRHAMKRLESRVPELVLLDMNLPYVSGADILKAMRLDPRLAGARVVVATANPHMADEVTDLADLVLIKPVGFKQLLDLARRLHPDGG